MASPSSTTGGISSIVLYELVTLSLLVEFVDELTLFELVILFELTALFELVTVEEADSDKTDAISAEKVSEFIYTEDTDTELSLFKSVCAFSQAVNIIPASKLIDIPAKIIFLITFLLYVMCLYRIVELYYTS